MQKKNKNNNKKSNIKSSNVHSIADNINYGRRTTQGRTKEEEEIYKALFSNQS